MSGGEGGKKRDGPAAKVSFISLTGRFYIAASALGGIGSPGVAPEQGIPDKPALACQVEMFFHRAVEARRPLPEWQRGERKTRSVNAFADIPVCSPIKPANFRFPLILLPHLQRLIGFYQSTS